MTLTSYLISTRLPLMQLAEEEALDYYMRPDTELEMLLEALKTLQKDY